MKDMKNKIIDSFNKLNKRKYMVVIWLVLISVLVWFLFPLFGLAKVWKIGLIFLIFNNCIAFAIGNLINKQNLTKWWLLLLPIVFALAVTAHFAKYNYILCLVYLIFEAFGLWSNSFYREKYRRG